MRLPLPSAKRPLFTSLFLLTGLGIATLSFVLLRQRSLPQGAQEQGATPKGTADTLRVVTLSGATTFFTYRDEPMGYQYELIRLFASQQRRPLKLYVTQRMEDAERLIQQGRFDLCITPHAVTHSARQVLRFTGPEMVSGLVLVQRKPKAGDTTAYLRRVTDLLGREITLLEGSRAQERLRHLEAQLGGHIPQHLLQGDTINSEDLIADVATGELSYTIADEELARLSKTYYPNLDLSLEVGFKQRLQWFTSPANAPLAEALDAWASTLRIDKRYEEIYRRYFELIKSESPAPPMPSPAQAAPASLGHLGLSPFDRLFEQEAKRLGWPWPLLASIAYQESNFRPEVIGWSGARGLMGIMPRTGRIYGASKEELLHPATSVRVAVDCLLAIDALFKPLLPQLEERMRVTLAAYNAGPAHLQDAIRLAKKYGYAPDRWEGGIEVTLRLKSEAKYYNDPVCRAGYVRGKGVSRYVQEVISRYEGYLEKTKHTSSAH